MSRTRIALIVSTSLLCSTSASFAFGVPGLKADAPAAAASNVMSPADIQSKYDVLSKGYFGATKDLKTSQAYAFEAVGLKERSEQMKAEANQIGSSALSAQDTDKNSATTKDAAAEIKKKLSSSADIGEEGKKNLQSSMKYLATGIIKEMPLVKTASDLAASAADTVKNPSPAMLSQIPQVKSNIEVLTALGKNMANDISISKDSLKSYIDYAKAHAIEVPSECSDVFK